MEINLKNKTAWVFGGSRGIGQAIAIELSKAGANILLIARKKTALHKTQEMLCVQQQQQHDVLSVDMGNVSLLIESMKKYRNVNSVDILINNSGGPAGGLAHTAEIEEYVDAFKQHLLSAQAATQVVLPVMKKKTIWKDY